MQRKIVKLIHFFMVLALCAGVLNACKKSDPLAKSGFDALTVDGKGRIHAEITVDLRTVQAHTGEKAFLYEALPGEPIASLTSREPLDEAKVDASMHFRCPLTDEDGRSRLYSSFYVMFEDGTLLFEDGYYVENPQKLAKNTAVFAWQSSPKALCGANADDAAAMNVAHVMYEVTLSELMNGTETFDFHGNTYTLSTDVLAALDKQIVSATDAGLQVSLTVIPDSVPSTECFAAVADRLAARYAGGENGLVSALFLQTADSAMMPEFCRLATLALRSHVANGRVYVIAPSGTLSETQAFFADLQLSFAASGDIEWGAAVIPQATDDVPWENTDTDAMSVANFSALSDFLYSSSEEGRLSYFAVCGVAFDAADEDKQAVSYAYTYYAAVSANAGLIFYRDHVDEATGLRNEDGESRRIISVISDIDLGLSPADERLCEQIAGEAWGTYENVTASRVQVSGTSNIGTAGLTETILFDFTDGECHGFVGAGSLTVPESHHSASWNTPVLYTWINPTYGNAGGVRKVLANGEQLEDATSLSVQLLTQIPDTDACTVHLTLESVTEQGTRLTYENSVEISNGKWQTVTFGISSFVADFDPAQPCVLTLTAEPLSDVDEDYVLWVRGINARYPERDLGGVLSVLIILACVSVGFLAVFLIYRKTAAKVRPRQR
ncbi:MAG: hypothetical protein IJW55_06095 [Clostridia bacterium]|nr:hypothetical protein [Clostridia bacterium]